MAWRERDVEPREPASTSDTGNDEHTLSHDLASLEEDYRRLSGARYLGPDDERPSSPAAPGEEAAAPNAPGITGADSAASETGPDGPAPQPDAAEPSTTAFRTAARPTSDVAMDAAAADIESMLAPSLARALGVESRTEPDARRETQRRQASRGAPRAKERPADPDLKAAPTSPIHPTLDGEAHSISGERLEKALTTGGAGGGKDGGGRRGGGGGGGVPLQQRANLPDFQKAMAQGLAHCRRNLITVFVFSVVANLLLLAIPIYLFQLSDRVLTSRSTDTLVMLTIIVVGALCVHVILDMMRRLILMRVAVELESRLGAPVLSAAAKASNSGSGSAFQALGDLQQLRGFITGPVLLTLFDVPVAPVYLLVVYLIHPQLGFVVFVAMCLLMVVALINQRLVALPFGRANAFASRANVQADAMARNTQIINAMGMIPEGVQIWGRETAQSLKSQVAGQDRNVLMSGFSKSFRLGTQVTVLGWGTWLALGGELTGGTVIAASIIGARALAPVDGAIEGWRSFIGARAAWGRIQGLLRSSPLNVARLRLPRPQGRLDVERVLYVPPPEKKVILNGITFSLRPGQLLAVVGSSGAGKSTLGKMLVGSIAPTAGNVRLDLMDLRNWDPRQFGENVGYLPQDVQLFPATIKANIARMRSDASDEDIFEAAELADVHGMISHFSAGYETWIGVDGAPLSGGQKQRIGLARAFFGRPRLVVLDEPNSNLDTPGERALARALARAKEQGITVVAITQRPSLLKSVDSIMILDKGTVQAFGRREEILPMISARRGGQRGALPGAA